jgi:very-short-patch-repair endonuclease
MQPKPEDRVLVAILNKWLDFGLAHDKHWYRIPLASAEKWLKGRWPPDWLAFYQTKLFGQDAFAVHYYARVVGIKQVSRAQLFPDEPADEKSHRRYYKLLLKPLKRLENPILSRRRRRIVFIPTTGAKFLQAVEINDLYDESPLEDVLWAQFKRLQIAAERQEFVRVKKKDYALDFAIYCGTGKLDVETDGDLWHASPESAAQDRPRDNDLNTVGWRVLRFGTREIQEQMASYCLPTIVDNINRLGGVDEGGVVRRKIELRAPDGVRQMTLWEGR